MAVKLPLIQNDSQLSAFRREGSLLACVAHEGLARVYEVGVADGKGYIVSEFLDGATLADELRQGSLSPGRVERLAITLAGALSAIHGQGLVHRDIKPSNILCTSSGPKLIDFGLATRGNALPENFAGTLLYASPEQTGLLKRPVDARSDLYSLGAVLFECLVGRPVFWGEPKDLIRQHATVKPPNVCELNPRVPRVLALVIDKLLAKDPDDRYRSAGSLEWDLRSLASLDRLSGAVSLDCSPHHTATETPMVGRHTQLEGLDRLWEEVSQGSGGAAALVMGPGGSGKSRLFREWRSHLSGKPIVFTARCQQQGSTPYQPMREAVEGALLAIRRLSPNQVKTARRQVASMARGRTRQLSALTPMFEEFLVEEALAPEPAGDSLSDGFYDVVLDWLLEYAQVRGGAILILDDIQWIDEGSLKLLLRLGRRLGEAPLMVGLTSRELTGPVQEVVNGFGAALQSNEELPPLASEEVQRLISHLLGGGEVEPQVVAQIAARSRGNPFAVEQYVRACLDQGLLRPSWGVWVADIEELTHLQLPEDVFDLILRRLEGLGPEALEVLQVAAVVGNLFETGPLAKILGRDSEEALSAAVAEGILERRPDLSAGTLQFVHDRLREAMLSGLEPARLQQAHLEVAEVLEKSADLRHVYAVARHYREGRGPSAKVLQTSLKAAHRALEEFAFESAYEFLTRCLEIEETAQLLEDLALACEMTGRAREAFEFLGRAVELESSPLKRAERRLKRCHLGLQNPELGAGGKELQKALEEVGARAPKSRWSGALGAGLSLLLGRGQKPATPEHLRVEAQLYEQLSQVAFFRGDVPGLLESIARGAVVSRQMGDCPERVDSLCHIGFMLAYCKLPGWSERLLNQAELLAARIGDPLAQRTVLAYQAIRIYHLDRVEESLPGLRQALFAEGPRLPMTVYNMVLGLLSWSLMLRGSFPDLLNVVQQVRQLFHVHGDEMPSEFGVLAWHQAVALTGLGRGDEVAAIARPTTSESGRPIRAQRLLQSGCRILMGIFEGDLGPHLDEAIDEVGRIAASTGVVGKHLRHAYVARAYALLYRCQSTEKSQRGPILNQFGRAVKDLKKQSSYLILRGHWLCLEGARQRLNGHHQKAHQLLDAAQDLADRSDSLWMLFEVLCERARCRREQGLLGASRRCAELAYQLAQRSGWVFRARQIAREASLTGAGSTANLRESVGSASASQVTSGLLQGRQLEALRELSLASARIFDPDRLAQVVLAQVVQLLGAQRAILLLRQEGQLRILAARTPEGPLALQQTNYSKTVVQKVLDHGYPVIINGVEQGREVGSKSVVLHDLRSILAVPLRLRDEVIGVLYLDNSQARGLYNQDDQEILDAMASYIAVGLETTRALSMELKLQMERDHRELAEALQEFSAGLAATTDVGVIFQKLEAVLQKRFGEIRFQGYLGATGPDLILRAVTDRKTIVEGSRMAVPCVGVEGSPVGAFLVEGASGERDREFAETVSGHTALAIQKAILFGQLTEFASTDALTGISNRRHFFELADRVLAEARRHRSALSVIILDVDHFKKFNDTHGHDIGDLVLREVAASLQKALRTEDLLARYGGEEFVMLLPQTGLADAGSYTAERIRALVESTPVETPRGALRVTISLGLASADWGTDVSIASLLKRADEGLYAAKGRGRNCWVALDMVSD